MNLNPAPELAPQLKQLRLSGILDSLEARNREAIHGKLAYTDFLALLISDEVARREQKKFTSRLRRAQFRTTKTLDQFDFDRLAPAVRIVRRIADVLDPAIGPDDAKWSEMRGLKAKRERDAERGNGFKMQIVEAEQTSVPTLRKGYHKGGSTDPVLRHPDRPELLRRFTSAEHARIKGVPDHLVEGLSETTAHQLLGQGIVYEPFRAVGQRIAERISEAIERIPELPQV
jgi:DNA (cytosine-5)-methyltransferase 1